jgi:glycosyltransferase involved in cell wall biosynthesis
MLTESAKAMRIVYLHQYFVTPQMAGGSRSYEMARRLVVAGHEVHMVTSDRDAADAKVPWRHSVEAGIHVHWTPIAYDNRMSYGARMRAFLRFAWRAARKAVALRGDVVFATSTPLTIAIPAVYAARRLRVPMVFEVRDLWPEVPIAIGAIRSPAAIWAARWLERLAYRNASRVVALAPGMRDSVVATGYPRERVAVIPNGCDFDLFADPDAGVRLREHFSWLGSRPLLVFT